MKRSVSLLLCIMLLICAFGCTSVAKQPHEKQKAFYEDIISEYTALLTAKQNGEELPVPSTRGMSKRQAAIAEALYGIVDAYDNVTGLGYAFKDIDGNGSLELLLMSRYTSIYAIFTLSGRKPILLESVYGANGSLLFAPRNRFFLNHKVSDGSTEEITYYICRVDGDQMAYDSVYGTVYDRENKTPAEHFQITDGNREVIDTEAFNGLHWEHRQAYDVGYGSVSKLLSPRIHFPLAADTAGDTLPVADFSDYAAILETYDRISTCLDTFASLSWTTGEYDTLFSFPDDRSYDYYNRLLYAAYHGSGNIGFSETDLNGDGQNELILLNEDYRIKAIFTKKDGVPVLLDAFAYEICWLDDRGFIHVDDVEYNSLEYAVYELTKSGEYRLDYSLLIAGGGFYYPTLYYLTRDGKTEQISYEQSMELYDNDYCRYSEPFTPNEQTRNVSKLTYTPLTEFLEDRVAAAVDKAWYKNADLEKTTGKDLAYGRTLLSFARVTDTHLKVDIQYTFSFHYPDPNRDNYLIADVTESELSITAHEENGCYVFEEAGIKGKLEFLDRNLWMIIEQSSDERFAVGSHCYEQYIPEE
ncbi:MAG: hypothetical protein IJW97_08380 [Clostridia bacterium]|nr:hypothetical protein [Clostridia bacterium]